MPKKVLLINSNREINPNPVLPIGMAYVASSLNRAGFEVKCADLCFKKNWKNYLTREMRKFSPDFIGISIRNIDNHDESKPIFYLENVKQIVNHCKNLSGAKLFCGGAALAVMPKPILGYLGIDIGIFGDGEETAPKLIKSWENGKPDTTLPGLVFRDGEHIRSNPPSPINDVNSIFYNELPRWIDTSPYFKREASYPVQAKRGCPFDCIYCTYARGEGKRYRFRSAESVAREVMDIHEKHHPKTIEFVDSIFNHPSGFAEDICRELILRKNKAKLHTIELNPGFLTGELIDLMEKAGFVSCGVTCESASDEILKNLQKSYRVKDIVSAARILRKSKMKKLWIFLLGGPGENEKTLEETLSFVRNELTDNDIVFFNIGIRIYPGTDIETIALKEHVIEKDTDLLNPAFYISPLISREKIEETIANEKRVNIVSIKDIRLPYLSSLLRISGFLHLKGPYWSYAPTLNRIRGHMKWLK